MSVEIGLEQRTPKRLRHFRVNLYGVLQQLAEKKDGKWYSIARFSSLSAARYYQQLLLEGAMPSPAGVYEFDAKRTEAGSELFARWQAKA